VATEQGRTTRTLTARFVEAEPDCAAAGSANANTAAAIAAKILTDRDTIHSPFVRSCRRACDQVLRPA
jgi:hypothetical protein